MPSMAPFFEASGCAVVGASSNPSKAGYQILANMASAGYDRGLFPVTPSGGEILGQPSLPSLDAIGERVELVVIAAPAAATPDIVAQMERRMARRGDIKAVVCAAAGFAEVGTEEGKTFQKLLAEFCREHGIRLLGPNCVGVIDANRKIDTTFIAGTAHIPGGISFVSQSGAVGAWLLMSWASAPAGGVGFNKFVTVGNMADVDIIEAISYAGADPATSALGVYLEGSPYARRLVDATAKVAEAKPVVVLKVGRTGAGAQAAQSHTGSLAGSDALYEGAFRQCGIQRAYTIDDLSDQLRAFASLPLPAGDRVFILTQAGGPGIFCVDELAQAGLFKPALVSEATKAAIRAAVPPIASVCHPEGHADITAAASAEHHFRSLEAVLRDPGVDAVLFITVATLFLDLTSMARGMVEAVARLRAEGIYKPVYSTVLAGDWTAESRGILEKAGLPTFDSPDRAVRALAAMRRYASFRERNA
jgi:acyl-CoA synthetase (NDP forming)